MQSKQKTQTRKASPQKGHYRATTNIFVGHHGGIISSLPAILPKNSDNDFTIEEGHVVSEVGPSCTMMLKGCGNIAAYQLRKSPWKNTYLPRWVPGHIDLGESFACFNPVNFSLPAVGQRRVIDPVVTPIQNTLINYYRTIQAKAVYIFIVSCPLGAAPYLRIRPCEIDETTETLGIRWKPAGQNTIAVALEWSNDHKVVLQSKPRPGQSGLSLEVTLMEDNSIETVNTPLNVTALCYVYDVQCTGWKASADILSGVSVPALNFTPAATQALLAINE